MLAGAGVGITDKSLSVVVSIRFGTDAFMQAHSTKAIKGKGADHLTRLLVHIPNKQVKVLVATKLMAQSICYLERGVDFDLSRETCSRTDDGELYMLEHVPERSGADGKGTFFDDGRPARFIN